MKTFSGRKPSQREDELSAFIDLLNDRGTRSYLEIGARHGDTFHAVMSTLPKGSLGVAVDLPGAAWGTETSERSLRLAACDLRDRGYQIVTVIANSQVMATRDHVRHAAAHRGCKRFDAALIDGDHRYEGVMTDWLIWGSEAAIIAFHDIAGEGVTSKADGFPVEVPRAWSEIKGHYPHRELIGTGSSMGIGVLWRAPAS